MNRERWERIQRLFDEAAALPAHERGAFLDERCADDGAIKREVLALLDNDRDGDSQDRFVDAIGDEQKALGISDEPQERRGETIGVYTIVRKIAEGGMGEVFEAQQSAPIKRTVALKVIRSHLASSTVISRFEVERQTLALMDHDAIAKIFDAGATESGQPYFVMELVNGTPIDRACADRRLSLEERLKLFLRVCSGVQHAHQKGVIHRDLKPSNILVADGPEPSIKIIDFGIAKLSNAALEDAQGHTLVGSTLGTPEYMSPEQADTLTHDIDTRTDVYALGAVLYKMLTGHTPLKLDGEDFASRLEMLKAIKERQPESLRARIQREGTAAAAVTQSAKRYAAQLRGELNWIVLRALEKARGDRYPSVSALAADVERYLDNRPVEARPQSGAYRLRKFVLRNQAATLAGVGITLALVVGLVVSTQATARAQRAEAEALRQVRIAGANIRFLTSVLATSHPSIGRGDMTAKQMLEVAVGNVDDMLADDPEVRASVYTTIGRVYRETGFLERASELFQRAIAQFDHMPVEGNERRIAHTMNNLSTLERALGNLDRALALGEQSLEMRLRVVAPSHEFVGRSYSLIGLAESDLGRYEEAEAALILARDIAAGDAPRSAMHAWGLFFMGRFLSEQGRYEEALAHQEQATEIFGHLPRERRNYGNAQMQKGLVLLALGDEARGRAALAEGRGILLETYESHDFYLARCLTDTARAFGDLGEWDAAREDATTAVAIFEDLPVENSFHPAAAYEQLALAQAHLGEQEAALASLARAEAIRARTQDVDHPLRRHADLARAQVYLLFGDAATARPLLLQVAAHLARSVGEAHIQSRRVAGLIDAAGGAG